MRSFVLHTLLLRTINQAMLTTLQHCQSSPIRVVDDKIGGLHHSPARQRSQMLYVENRGSSIKIFTK